MATPDIFRENSEEYLQEMIKLCERYGFDAYTSQTFYKGYFGKSQSKQHERYVVENTFSLIDEIDIVIANIQPFRGACIDDNTAIQIGYALFKNKLIYGYRKSLIFLHKTIVALDGNVDSTFPIVEEFDGQIAASMLEISIEKSGGKMLKTLEECLIDIANDKERNI